MEEEVKKLRAAGFSDEDIRAYMEAQKSSSSSAAPAPISPDQMAAEPARVNETVPDYGGTTAPSMAETAGTVVAAVAPYAIPAAIGGAGLYGASVLKSGFNAMKESAASRTAQANAQLASQQGLQQRFDAREARLNARAAPTPTPTTSPILDARGQPIRPVTAPAVPAAAPPAAAPPAAQQPGVMQRGMDYARQMQKIAADKVMQGARAVAPYARTAGVGLTAALMPGNAGQNYPVPQKGPFRGMEINPNTGRPWTPQELAEINR